MITTQTQLAFGTIKKVLVNSTEDNLDEIIENLESLLFTAKEIANTVASIKDGSDYDPQTYCNIPTRF